MRRAIIPGSQQLPVKSKQRKTKYQNTVIETAIHTRYDKSIDLACRPTKGDY